MKKYLVMFTKNEILQTSSYAVDETIHDCHFDTIKNIKQMATSIPISN